MKKLSFFFLFFLPAVFLHAQGGNLSGDLMINANFYQRDTGIKTPDNPLYNNALSGGEGWLSLRYSYKGFIATVRADAFHNSNLFSPGTPYNGFGLGAWNLSKEINELTVTAGYIYDQVGSGLLFRAYEDRGLLIDNALVGLHLKYKLADNITLKAFSGQQKGIPQGNLMDKYKPIIKGFNAEGDFNIGEKVHITPGVGVINRTLDQDSWSIISGNIQGLDSAAQFYPRYNMYAFSVYNTLNVGDFSWFIEGAYKTHEAIEKNNLLQDLDGNVVFTTLGYARKGFAINLIGKRTENFEMRTSPNEILLRGLLNWQPIVARLRPQRLMARYTPASQNLSEMAAGGDILISPNDNVEITLNYTHINTLGDTMLYREAYGELVYRGLKKCIIQAGVQYMRYNQELYQVRPGVPIVEAITPYAEVTYKITNNKSVRAEVEYMSTKQDYGSWLFALLEFNIAPKFSFAVSDMYTAELNKENVSNITTPQHFYSIFTAYSKGPHRFTLAYVKQVDGINCTGGVCRYEPAFNGIKFTVTSSF